MREAIFVSDRFDTLGVGLKLRDSLRACSEGYPVTLGTKLHRERKPADDYFLFLHLVLLIKLNPQGLSGAPICFCKNAVVLSHLLQPQGLSSAPTNRD